MLAVAFLTILAGGIYDLSVDIARDSSPSTQDSPLSSRPDPSDMSAALPVRSGTQGTRLAADPAARERAFRDPWCWWP